MENCIYNDENLVYINCYFYSFYIRKEQFKKYNINQNIKNKLLKEKYIIHNKNCNNNYKKIFNDDLEEQIIKKKSNFNLFNYIYYKFNCFGIFNYIKILMQ